MGLPNKVGITPGTPILAEDKVKDKSKKNHVVQEKHKTNKKIVQIHKKDIAVDEE